MKTRGAKNGASKNGKAKRGVMSNALRAIGKHPKTTAAAAGVLAAGVGAYALLRRGKKAKSASAKGANSAKVGGRAKRGAGHPSNAS